MECLENIIGLTQNDCNCFDGDKPADFATINASSSGLYITDDGDGFPLLSGVFQGMDCGRGDNVFQVLQNARTNAINSFLADFSGYRAMGLKSSEGFEGMVGRLKNSSSQVPSGTYAGIAIAPPAVRGRSLVITDVHLGFADAHTTTVTIASDNPDFAPTTVDVTNLAGKYGKGTFASPVSLDFTDGYNYLLYYEVDGRRALRNDFKCCGHYPKWQQFFSANGFISNDIDKLLQEECVVCACGCPYGMAFNGYVSCNDDDWLCTPERYGKNGFDRIIAKTLQYKAAANTVQYILDSPNINSYTLLSREGLYGKPSKLLKIYDTNTRYLAQNAPSGSCLGCKKSIVSTQRASLV